MSALEQNISGSRFVEQANSAVDGLELTTGDSSATAITKLNTAFSGLTDGRVIVDKRAPDFIADVNYNIDLMGSGDTPVVDEKMMLPAKPRMLFIGNSLTLDGFSYLPWILKAHGINAIVGLVFKHGMNIKWYHDNFDNSGLCFLYVCDTEQSTPKWYDFGTSKSNGEWCFPNPKAAVTATSDGLRSYMGTEADAVNLTGKWDLISIQSFGKEAYSSDMTQNVPLENIYHLLVDDLIGAFQTSEFYLGFSLPSHTLFDGIPRSIMSRTQAFVANNNGNSERKRIDVVFPFGTAIFNARTHTEMRSLYTAAGPVIQGAFPSGAYFPGRKLYGDNLHSNEGMPCFIAALAVAETLFRNVEGYEENEIDGNEILPAVNGVYPNNDKWEEWSVNSQVRNPNGQNHIFGLDGQNGGIVPNGFIGSVSRQWAKWFAENAVDNPYSLVSQRIDGGSTDITVTVIASHCSVVVGSARNPSGQPGTAAPETSYPYYYNSGLWLWVVPDEGYAVDQAYWTVLWRYAEGSSNDFKVNFATEGDYRKFLFNNINDDLVIYATATLI